VSAFEYNTWQWWFRGLRNARIATSDAPADRPLDTAEVTAITDAPWLSSERSAQVANKLVEMPQPWRAQASFGGRSMQRAHPFKKVNVPINNTYSGKQYPAVIPNSMTGQFWVEGNPAPLWAMAASVPYDKHVILCHDDGRSTELIGVSRWGKYRALGCARWTPEGVLEYPEDDRPVTWGGKQMSRQILDARDQPHRLAITIQGSDEEPEFFPWKGVWLALDPAKAPTGLPAPAQRVVDMLVTHGCTVEDHGGKNTLSITEGAQWAGIDWQGVHIPLSSFAVAQ